MVMIIHFILIVIFTIITVVSLINFFFTFSEHEKNVNCIICAISCLSATLLTVLFIVGLIRLAKQEWNTSDEPYRTDYIASLNDGTQTNGRFYLTHGYIEEDMYYQYMIKRSDGGYSYDKAREDIATIYISDGNYRVEWYIEERHWLWFDDERSICKIYVPQGCIKEEYNIDLE